MTWIDGTGYVVSPLDGVNGILIAGIDGGKGFAEPIAAVYPQTVVPICIVHLIRNRLMQ